MGFRRIQHHLFHCKGGEDPNIQKDYSRGINILMENQGSFSWPQTKGKANENPDFIYNKNFEMTRRYSKRHNQKQVVMKVVKTEV